MGNHLEWNQSSENLSEMDQGAGYQPVENQPNGDQSASHNGECEICLIRNPTWKCVECNVQLCDRCKEHHSRIRLCHDHTVTQLSEDGTETDTDKTVFCEKHAGQPIILNCQECEELLCGRCKETAHQSHKTETIDEALQRVMPEMEGCCEKIKVKELGAFVAFSRTHK